MVCARERESRREGGESEDGMRYERGWRADGWLRLRRGISGVGTSCEGSDGLATVTHQDAVEVSFSFQVESPSFTSAHWPSWSGLSVACLCRERFEPFFSFHLPPSPVAFDCHLR
jgi:hypothetical protein